MELLQRGAVAAIMPALPALDMDDVEDLDEAPDSEVEAAEEQILDQATAARSIVELRAEVATLQQLEGLALGVRRGGEDRKWRELANLLSEIFTTAAVARPLPSNGEASSDGPGSALKSKAQGPFRHDPEVKVSWV
jgi:hypothetical protein